MRFIFLCLFTLSLFASSVPKEAKIYVAGHKGMVGRALVRKLEKEGFQNILTRDSKELDLRDASQVQAFFEKEAPEYVYLAAAKVGGILANSTYPADFIYDNLAIEMNVIHTAYQHNVKKLLFLGSSCIYPKLCPQPIEEASLLAGKLEPTNDAYALAKICGIKLCQAYHKQHGCNFISCMPTNLYGPFDNFHPENSHLVAALIQRLVQAKKSGSSEVVLWGTGTPKREFLHVDDLADACLFLMDRYDDPEIINIGTGKDISIRDFADCLKDLVGFNGSFVQDRTKPDGTPVKRLDITKIQNLGWSPSISLKEGLKDAILWYEKHAP